MMVRTFSWLLGIDRAASIERINLALAAPWVEGGAFWVFLIVAALLAGSLVFYSRFQTKGSRTTRTALGLFRGLLLALVVVTLADPVLELTVVSRQRPLVYAIFDGTDSMAIEDELSPADRAAIEKATDWNATSPRPPKPVARR